MTRYGRNDWKASLQIVVVVLRKRLRSGILRFLLDLSLGRLVDNGIGRSQGGRLHKGQIVVARQLTSQPEEGLFEVVVRLGRDVVVLKVLLAVEGDLLRLDLAVLDFDLVAGQHNGNVFTDPSEITVPVRHIFVRDTRGNIKHDNGALPLDVVAITESTKFFLPRRIPDVEFDRATIGEERQGMNFHTEGRDVFLFELTGQVTLDKGGLSHAAVADEDEFELGGRRVFSLCE